MALRVTSLTHSDFFNEFVVNSYFHGRGDLAVAWLPGSASPH